MLAFTSCSKTQQPRQVANNVAESTEPESHDAPDGHSADDHHGQTHEAGNHHGSHGDAHADHHVAEHKSQSGKAQHGAHRHGHGGHGHSGEHAADDSKHVAVGEKVPDFEVMIDGEKVKLSELQVVVQFAVAAFARTRFVRTLASAATEEIANCTTTELQKNTSITEDGTLVLTFWCSFCHSCRHVEHALDELAMEHKGEVGVIALDASAGETADGVAEFAKENEVTLPIALNTNGTAADIFGARVTTTTVVIDGAGVLRYCGQFGDDRHAFAKDALKAVLAGKEVHVKKTQHKGWPIKRA